MGPGATCPLTQLKAGGAGGVGRAHSCIAVDASGRASCVSASVPSALVSLAGTEPVRGSADAVQYMAQALSNISLDASGRASCVSAGVPSALFTLLCTDAVRGSSEVQKATAQALFAIFDWSSLRDKCIVFVVFLLVMVWAFSTLTGSNQAYLANQGRPANGRRTEL